MKIIIHVDCDLGEDSMWMSDISPEEFEILKPLIDEIYKNSGYFPTGSKWNLEDPTVEDLYGGFKGIEDFISRIPCPIHGIERISEIYVFCEEPFSLYM
jgi:hypothetical protein